ncbi:PBS lyase HEAT-like repeat protein [Clostridiales bacterium oral taxon 876 str. F0540]|nr:PBS lyase HEAT-like repeat protein [Clostridiales bacterium oral taxon 876 str. F0540]
MDRGLVKIDWKELNNLTEEDITYFLSLEGKTVDAICRIRKMDREEVQRHIIDGKVKYRFLAKSNNEQELFITLCNAGKQDKLSLLSGIDNGNKIKLLEFIRKQYAEMNSKYKETAIWIIGELKALNLIDILNKALVHKHVNIRRMAVSAMGKLADKACEVPLIRALDDENPQVVMYAVKALSKLKSERAIEKVKQIHICSEKDYLRNAAEEFIKAFEA